MSDQFDPALLDLVLLFYHMWMTRNCEGGSYETIAQLPKCHRSNVCKKKEFYSFNNE